MGEAQGPASKERFAEFFKDAMAAAGYKSLATFARASGLSLSMVSRYYNAQALPTEKSLKAMSPVLGIPPLELMTMSGRLADVELGGDHDPVVRRIMSHEGLSAHARRAIIAVHRERRANLEKDLRRQAAMDIEQALRETRTPNGV